MGTGTSSAPKVGDKAPDFTLQAQNGTIVSLHDLLKNKALVIFFYPKDNTMGCTAENCAFRDSYTVFQEAGAEVVGISSDSVTTHARFADKHHLPYTLLSDQHGAVRKLYGVPKTMGLLPGRVTYVIDKAGIIRLIFNNQLAPLQHIEEALKVLKEM